MSMQRLVNSGIGLKNLGNTCFLNSILQSFSSLKSFIKFLENIDNKEATFSTSLLECMHALQPTSNKSTSLFDTNKILDEIKQYNHDFAGSNQQDAEELLQVIMNIIKEEIEDIKCSRINSLKISNKDLIDNPFEGWLTSNLVCHDCNTTRPTKHQIFVDLSIPLKPPPVGEIRSPLINLQSQQYYLGGSMRVIKSVIPRCSSSSQPRPAPLSVTMNPPSNQKDIRSHPIDVMDMMFDSETNIEHSVNTKLKNKQLSQRRIYDHYSMELKDCLRDFTRTELLSDIECESCCCSDINNTKGTPKNISLPFITNIDHPEFNSEDPSIANTNHSVGDMRCNSPNLTTTSSISSTTTNSNISTRTLAFKQLSVSRLPTVLCLHLSRKVHVRNNTNGRNYGGEVTYRQEKLRHMVRFEETLDMSSYLENHSISSSNNNRDRNNSSNGSSSFYSSKSDTSSKTSHSIIYFLRAVVVHLGSAESGHYVTYRRLQPKSGEDSNSDCWIYVSDEVVRIVPLEDVLKTEAYMLFYELPS